MASAGAKGKAETLDRPLFLGPSPSFDMRDATVVMPSSPRYPRAYPRQATVHVTIKNQGSRPRL